MILITLYKLFFKTYNYIINLFIDIKAISGYTYKLQSSNKMYFSNLFKKS